jgi:hypothetical protein
MASNFRALFHLQYNQWAGKGQRRTAKQLWPLSFDNNEVELTESELYRRNTEIIESYKEKYGIN